MHENIIPVDYHDFGVPEKGSVENCERNGHIGLQEEQFQKLQTTYHGCRQNSQQEILDGNVKILEKSNFTQNFNIFSLPSAHKIPVEHSENESIEAVEEPHLGVETLEEKKPLASKAGYIKMLLDESDEDCSKDHTKEKDEIASVKMETHGESQEKSDAKNMLLKKDLSTNNELKFELDLNIKSVYKDENNIQNPAETSEFVHNKYRLNNDKNIFVQQQKMLNISKQEIIPASQLTLRTGKKKLDEKTKEIRREKHENCSSKRKFNMFDLMKIYSKAKPVKRPVGTLSALTKSDVTDIGVGRRKNQEAPVENTVLKVHKIEPEKISSDNILDPGKEEVEYDIKKLKAKATLAPSSQTDKLVVKQEIVCDSSTNVPQECKVYLDEQETCDRKDDSHYRIEMLFNRNETAAQFLGISLRLVLPTVTSELGPENLYNYLGIERRVTPSELNRKPQCRNRILDERCHIGIERYQGRHYRGSHVCGPGDGNNEQPRDSDHGGNRSSNNNSKDVGRNNNSWYGRNTGPQGHSQNVKRNVPFGGARPKDPQRIPPRGRSRSDSGVTNDTLLELRRHANPAMDTLEAFGLIGLDLPHDPGGQQMGSDISPEAVRAEINEELYQKQLEIIKEMNHCVWHCMVNPFHQAKCRCCISVRSLLKHSGTCTKTRYNCENKCQKTSALLLYHCTQCLKEQNAAKMNSVPDGIPYPIYHCGVELCDKLRLKFLSKASSHSTKKSLNHLWDQVKFWMLVKDHLKELYRLKTGKPSTEVSFDVDNYHSIGGAISGMLEDNLGSLGRPAKRGSVKRKPVVANLHSILEHPDEGTNEPDQIDGFVQSDFPEEREEQAGSSEDNTDNIIEPNAIIRQRRPQQLALRSRLADRGTYHSLGGPGGAGNESEEDDYDIEGIEVTSVPMHQRYELKGYEPVRFGTLNQLMELADNFGKLSDLLKDQLNNNYNVDIDSILAKEEESGILLTMDFHLNEYGQYRPDEEWSGIRILGTGIFGKCFLAEDNKDNTVQFCAKEEHITKFDPDELKIQAKLHDHPMVPKVYGALRHGRKIYILMEYIEGDTLASIIKEQGRLNSRTIKIYAYQLMKFLHFLQEKRVLHEDLKADNIMVKTGSTQVYVIDYSVAQHLPPAPSPPVTPDAQSPLGGQTTWSPEKAKSQKHDIRSEVWALACLEIQMLTGTEVWVSQYGNCKNLHFVIATRPPPIEEIPESTPSLLKDQIIKALGTNVDDRHFPYQQLQHPLFHDINNEPSVQRFEKEQLQESLAEANKLLSGDILEQLKSFESRRIATRPREQYHSLPVEPLYPTTFNIDDVQFQNSPEVVNHNNPFRSPRQAFSLALNNSPVVLPQMHPAAPSQSNTHDTTASFYISTDREDVVDYEDEELYGSGFGSLTKSSAEEGGQNSFVPEFSIPLTVDEAQKAFNTSPGYIDPDFTNLEDNDALDEDDDESLEFPEDLPPVPENPFHKVGPYRNYSFHKDMLKMKTAELSKIAMNCFSITDGHGNGKNVPLYDFCFSTEGSPIVEENHQGKITTLRSNSAVDKPGSTSEQPGKRLPRHSDSNISPYTVGISNIETKNDRLKVLKMLKKLGWKDGGTNKLENANSKTARDHPHLQLNIRKPYEPPLPELHMDRSKTAPVLATHSDFEYANRRTSTSILAPPLHSSPLGSLEGRNRASSGRSGSPYEQKRTNSSEEQFQILRKEQIQEHIHDISDNGDVMSASQLTDELENAEDFLPGIESETKALSPEESEQLRRKLLRSQNSRSPQGCFVKFYSSDIPSEPLAKVHMTSELRIIDVVKLAAHKIHSHGQKYHVFTVKTMDGNEVDLNEVLPARNTKFQVCAIEEIMDWQWQLEKGEPEIKYSNEYAYINIPYDHNMF